MRWQAKNPAARGVGVFCKCSFFFSHKNNTMKQIRVMSAKLKTTSFCMFCSWIDFKTNVFSTALHRTRKCPAPFSRYGTVQKNMQGNFVPRPKNISYSTYENKKNLLLKETPRGLSTCTVASHIHKTPSAMVKVTNKVNESTGDNSILSQVNETTVHEN